MIYDKIIFIFYIIFFIIIYFSNGLHLPQSYYNFVLLPVFLICIFLKKRKEFDLKIIIVKKINNIIEYFIIKNIANDLLFGIIIFIINLVIVSSAYPHPSYAWLKVFFGFAISVLGFTLITAYISSVIPRFADIFFTSICFVLSLSALINYILFVSSISDWSILLDLRFFPSWGHAPDHFPTTAALTYAIFLLPANLLMVISRNTSFKITNAVSSFLLFAALILTQSRGAILGYFTAIIVYIYFLKSFLKIRFFVYFVIALLFTFFISQSEGGFISRGASFRIEAWQTFWDIILKRALFGYGERTVFYVKSINDNPFSHAHNLFLNSELRGGVIGFVSLSYVFVKSLQVSYLNSKYSNNFIPFGQMVILLVACQFDYDLIVMPADWQWVTFWLPIGLCLGQSFSGNAYGLFHKHLFSDNYSS